MKTAGVYYIKNLLNEKLYIGSSVNIKGRLTEHKRKLKLNIHPSVPLQNSWNKYGEANFEFSILEEIQEKEDIYLEVKLLEQLYFNNINYNIELNSVKKVILTTKEFIEYKTKCRKNKIVSLETKQKISNTLRTNGIPEDQKKFMKERLFEERKNNPDKFKISEKNKEVTVLRVQKTFHFIVKQSPIKITNLRKFCRENKLSYRSMFKVAHQLQQSYQDYNLDLNYIL